MSVVEYELLGPQITAWGNLNLRAPWHWPEGVAMVRVVAMSYIFERSSDKAACHSDESDVCHQAGRGCRVVENSRELSGDASVAARPALEAIP
jgi:hypothetical protein